MPTSERPKHIEVETVDDVAVVSFNSEILNEQDVVQGVADEIDRLIDEQGLTQLVLDLDNVRYISTSMLSKLTGLHRKVETVKGRLRFCSLSPLVNDIFRISRIDHLLAIYDSREDPLKS